jgi:AcrR family transcriptional regulator
VRSVALARDPLRLFSDLDPFSVGEAVLIEIGPSIPKLERSKAKRRAKILDAARQLLKQAPEDFSMRILAQRADVSITTPYSLFGSKQGVILALLKREGDQFIERFNKERSADSLACIIEYQDSVFDLYKSDPPYFKTLLYTLYASDDIELRHAMRRPRIAYLKRLLREAIAAGTIGHQVSIGMISRQMFGLNQFFVHEWISGGITLERARIETEFGICVILLAIARDEGRDMLLERSAELEARLD